VPPTSPPPYRTCPLADLLEYQRAFRHEVEHVNGVLASAIGHNPEATTLLDNMPDDVLERLLHRLNLRRTHGRSANGRSATGRGVSTKVYELVYDDGTPVLIDGVPKTFRNRTGQLSGAQYAGLDITRLRLRDQATQELLDVRITRQADAPANNAPSSTAPSRHRSGGRKNMHQVT
jgi:hypothetical protein